MATKAQEAISAVVNNKEVHAILGEDAELFGAYRDVYDFIKKYYFQFKAVPDKDLLSKEFRDFEIVDTTAPTKFYIEGLREDFVRSRMENIMLKAGKAMQDGEPSPEVFRKLQGALAKLGRFSNAARDLDLTNVDLAEEHFKKLREISEEKGGTPGISTGFRAIDSAYTTGMAGGHSIVLLGYTGRAKSMWSSLLAVKAWEQGFKPMIVSLEMTPEEQAERVYAMMASGLFRISDLSRGYVSIDDFRDWGRRKFDQKHPFVVVSNEGVSDVTPNVVQGKIDTHRPDIVILDYLQLMMDNGGTSAMTPRMLNLSREVKMLAVSNNIPIVSITAVTDEDGDKRDSPPMLSQVAWSRGIEYDANLAIAVHKYDDSTLVDIVGRKNRHGPLFDFSLDVDFDRGIWNETYT